MGGTDTEGTSWAMCNPKHLTIFVLPELRRVERSPLTLLVLPDGNMRAQTTSDGYRAGASKVIAIAEHLALRTNVAAMVACVLSRDNVAKRSEGFFSLLCDEFVRLAAAIEARRTMVDA